MQLLVSHIRATQTLHERVELDAKKLLGEPPSYVRFNEPVRVEAQAQLTPSNILVTAKISTNASFTCARCLSDYTATIQGHFQDIFSVDLEIIQLDEMIREAVLIDIPLRGVCNLECKGLCEKCGINKNISSCSCLTNPSENRWAGLDQIRFNK